MLASQWLVGRSPRFLDALALIDRVAQFDVPVVIEGETGTGKELAARAIHYGSQRRDQPFVPVNCGAIPDALVENELFGHQRGAFTDARTPVPGLVEVAHRGTLFLDEVDGLSTRAQVALLRFLQDQTYRPLGSQTERRADVRIVAAANRPLEPLADAGLFRRDLLFRLRLFAITLPPLRERPGDAGVLAGWFVTGLNRRYGGSLKRVSSSMTKWLESQRWPGNVRELENVVHRQYLLAQDGELGLPGTEPPTQPADWPASPLLTYRAAKAAALAEFDRTFLDSLMRTSGGNVSAAARLACKERRALGKLLRKYGVRPELFKAAS
jgi:two-component system response regulator GlrR